MKARPDNLAELLCTLPPRTGLYVPDDLLELWFPPGAVDGAMDTSAQRSAENYAARFDCRFWHFPERKDGCFAKQPRD